MRRPDHLESFIRSHSTRAGGVSIREIRDEAGADALKLLPGWETAGKVLIMRAPGRMALPELGAAARSRTLFSGEVAEPHMMEAGQKAWRAVFWDTTREMGEAPVGKIDLGQLGRTWGGGRGALG